MSRASLMIEKQWLHALFLVAMLGGAWLISSGTAFRAGQLWGVTTLLWFWLAIGLAIAHQLFVWFCWRTELHGSRLTRTFGHLGFPLYAVGFSILALLRTAAVFVVAISNQGTLPGNTFALKLIALILLAPAAYLFYSVKRYFGFKRAFGIDHFDSRYRSMPFERRGIFRFTRNGMYTFGLLLLWVPAFWWASRTALCVAAINHLYIWVHYFATELPDIRRIYGKEPSGDQSETA